MGVVLIEVEKHGHVDLLAGRKPLLFKAKALYLVKIGCCSSGDDIVCSQTGDLPVTMICRFVERQGRLSRPDDEASLFWPEAPGQLPIAVRSKSDAHEL